LHFNPKHPVAEQLAWDAENNPRNVGFSHNVLARLSRDGDASVVEAITHVQSVDLVADPAATQGLFEEEQAAGEAGEAARLAKLADLANLTPDALRAARPEMVEQLVVQETRQLETLMEEQASRAALLERRLRIAELLHGKSAADALGPAFYEALLRATDDAHLETMIAERAQVLQQAATAGQLGGAVQRPRSVEQGAAMARQPSGAAVATAQDFARAIRNDRSRRAA
jgi:hypothetical protein